MKKLRINAFTFHILAMTFMLCDHLLATVIPGNQWLTILVAVPVTAVGTALGFLLMTDYFGFGVLVVLVFYFFHGRKWHHFT